jgi:hypothetical protein
MGQSRCGRVGRAPTRKQQQLNPLTLAFERQGIGLLEHRSFVALLIKSYQRNVTRPKQRSILKNNFLDRVGAGCKGSQQC